MIDYAATGSALSPIRQLARSLPGASFLLFHHQNKTGGDGWRQSRRGTPETHYEAVLSAGGSYIGHGRMVNGQKVEDGGRSRSFNLSSNRSSQG